MRSVMVAMVILSDRRAYVLHTKDVSENQHNAQFIAGGCWSSCQPLGCMLVVFASALTCIRSRVLQVLSLRFLHASTIPSTC